MPNRNSGLAELAQMMQLVNGGGQDNAAAQQQHAGLQWMQLQQQQQQRAAEQEFRQQQLELQGRHYGDELAYKDRALAQQGRFEDASIAKQQALFDQATRAQAEHQSLALANIGQNAKAEEDRARRDDLNQLLAMTRFNADIGARRYDDEQKMLATERQQLVHSNTSLLTHYLSNGGKFRDKVGLGFMEGISPKQAALMRMDAAQEAAKMHLADLAPMKLSYAIDPKKTTLAAIHTKLSELEELEPDVQQFLNLPKLKAEFGAPAAKGASPVVESPEIQKALKENPDLARKMNEQLGREQILRENDERKSADEEAKLRRWALERRLAPLPDPVPQF